MWGVGLKKRWFGRRFWGALGYREERLFVQVDCIESCMLEYIFAYDSCLYLVHR